MNNNKCPKCGAPRVNGPECPQCGVIYARAEQHAYEERRQQQRDQQKGPRQQQASPIPTDWIHKQTHYSIDCTACKLEAGMEKKSVPRFPVFIRIIGFIIAAPSAIGMLFGGLLMLKHGGFGLDSSVFFIGGGLVTFSAVGGLVGWLLLMHKRAFVCRRCGFLLDRA